MGNPLTPATLVYELTPGSEPQLAPDGQAILYTLTTIDRATQRVSSQLWRCAIDGSRVQRLTWSGARESGGRWSADGQSIAFISDRVAGSGLFMLPAAGGEARLVTQHASAITDLAWSPTGTQLAYVTTVDPANPSEAARPATAAPAVRVTRRLDYKADGRGYLDNVRRQVWLVDVATGQRRVVTSEPNDHLAPQWSPDGRWLAISRQRHSGLWSQLLLLELASGATRLIGPIDGAVAAWAWAPGSDRLLIIGDEHQSWQWDCWLYELDSERLTRLTDDPSLLIEGSYGGGTPPSAPVWLDEQRVLLHAIQGGASGLYQLDCQHRTLEPVQRWAAVHVGLSTDAARRFIVQAQSSLTTSGEISLYDRQSGTSRLVTHLSTPVLSDRPPARAERLQIQRGGLTIDAWLLYPPNLVPGRRYPVVLDVHGGPHNFYGERFSPVDQCLATHDLLVVYANPRGSSTYGRAFAQRVVQDWGGEDYADLLAVLAVVLARPEADPTRVGIYGASYGGYMTAWAIGQSSRFAAAVCAAPVFDLESFYGTSDIGVIFGQAEFGTAPQQAREWYAAHSPSTFAHQTRTPTLILHGEADERCPIGQGEQMFAALATAGCEVEFVRYPGGSHGFTTLGPPEHRHDYLSRVLRWFKTYLGEPTGAD